MSITLPCATHPDSCAGTGDPQDLSSPGKLPVLSQGLAVPRAAAQEELQEGRKGHIPRLSLSPLDAPRLPAAVSQWH